MTATGMRHCKISGVQDIRRLRLRRGYAQRIDGHLFDSHSDRFYERDLQGSHKGRRYSKAGNDASAGAYMETRRNFESS
jgi:hypothetical protein